MINTLRISKRFIEAGVPKKQAEIFAEAFKEIEDEHLEGVCTKSDLQTIRNDLRDARTDLKGDINTLRLLLGLGISWLSLLIVVCIAFMRYKGV